MTCRHCRPLRRHEVRRLAVEAVVVGVLSLFFIAAFVIAVLGGVLP